MKTILQLITPVLLAWSSTSVAYNGSCPLIDGLWVAELHGSSGGQIWSGVMTLKLGGGTDSPRGVYIGTSGGVQTEPRQFEMGSEFYYTRYDDEPESWRGCRLWFEGDGLRGFGYVVNKNQMRLRFSDEVSAVTASGTAGRRR